MTYKSMLKRFAPDWVVKTARVRRYGVVALDAIYDLRRYVKHSSVIHYDNDEKKIAAVITATYHNIEKGLSLPIPRPGFGRANVEKLVELVLLFVERYGYKKFLNAPVGAIKEYMRFNEGCGENVDWLVDKLKFLERATPGFLEEGTGGKKTIRRSDLVNSVMSGGAAVIQSRVTCRQFSDDPVTLDQIEQAVKVAQTAPCVCNRQSAVVRVFREREQIDKILDLQGGARGFGDRATALFCVSVDMCNFNGSGERYQGWIDGGMFAMNLVLGLHVQGLGACCLNWSKDRHADRKMRSLLSLPDSESIVMFVAAGGLPSEFIAAMSVRKDLDEVLIDAKLVV